jgi:hypothetical protein
VKRALLLGLILPSLLWAQKGDLAAPQKMAAPAAHAGEKSSPPTDKRVLHLSLKK